MNNGHHNRARRGGTGGGRGGRGNRPQNYPQRVRERNREEPDGQRQPPQPLRVHPQYWTRDEVFQIARLSSEQVVQKIQESEGAFLNAYQFPKFYSNHSVVFKLIKILNTLCNSSTSDFSLRMVSQVVTQCSGFMMKLKELIMTTEDTTCLQHFVYIFRFCIDNIPQSTMFKLPHSELKEQIKSLNAEENRTLLRIFEDYSKQYDQKKEEMIKLRREEQKRSASQQNYQGATKIDDENLQKLHKVNPPNNFREIEILPQAAEFKDPKAKPFLRPVIPKGSYRNWEHYLDVQFRLLREDFMSPLRDGIHEYLTGTQKNKNIHLYFGARVLGPSCLYSGIGFLIQFDVKASRLDRVRWEHSRRLIYGSLLCLSCDNYKTFHFASVVKRDPEQLQSGYLTIKFEGGVNAFQINPSTKFTMVESTAYFEAYRHVLEGLQQVTADQMPFTPYLVSGFDPKSDIPLPLCIRRSPVFDLNRALELKRAIAPIDVRQWPHLSNICLDSSQLNAFKMALSQQISVIQGPPGTGKTYIGLKIVQALLQNRLVWDPQSISPILVVCYTNHALDQFLDGIIDAPIKGAQKPKIVRVGGRCKSDKIRECAMANLVNTMKKNREVPRNVYREVMENKKTMKSLSEKLEEHMGAINAMEGKILTVEELVDVMLERHHQQLTYGLQGVPEHKHMEVWLKLWLLPAVDEQEHENVMDEEEQLAAALKASLVVGRDGIGTGPQENVGMGLEAPVEEQAGGIVIEDEHLIEILDEPQLLEEDRVIEGEEIELGHGRQVQPKIKEEVTSKKFSEKGGWQVKQLTPKERKNRISKGLQQTPMSEKEVRKIVDVWTLLPKQRWQLYQYWLNQFIHLSKAELQHFGEYYDRCARQCVETDHQLNKLTLDRADVVGMTTTGAAKHSYILKHFHPKILIVEEAAEVLESHIVTSLCASVEQLILIGDHKQLQPKLTCFDLEKYHLHLSLFERLADNGFPIATLEVQHRMRPEISKIVGKHIYDEKLEDHESVYKYEHIKGIGKDVFFIEHCQPEKDNPTGDQRSHANPFEADYVVSLTRHLLKQGYTPSDITILTMYRGQLFEIKQKMRRDEFGGVRVAAVDDFQGEENEIVIISLVRSNNEGKIGFLKVQNRICVSLSRAKKGMYVIGNFAMLRDKRDTKWPAILDQMECEGCLGEGLPLCCQVHSTEKVIAKSPQDFSKSPEGGCRKQCGMRLDCGHVCKSPCHPLDRDHQTLYLCQQACDRKLPCGHKCKRKCHECQDGCPPCEINVSRILHQCRHEVRMKCCVDPSTFQCYRPCEKRISRCGHKCQSKCSQPCTPSNLCQEIVPQRLSCGHKMNVLCSAEQKSIVCPESCKKLLDTCGHGCEGTCGSCSQGRLHAQCKKECGRTLNCGHICNFPCPEYCPPCDKPCRNYCFHSRCPKKCYEPCVPCREPCKWRCDHYQCTATCGEMCNRPPCNAPCRKRIEKCGHPCIGLCGEDCPKLCRTCDKEEVTEVIFGPEDEEDARFIQLKDCGHIVEVSSLDRWMEREKTVQESSEESHIIKFIECPKCKTPIRRSLRYGNIIKKTIYDMEQVKSLNIRRVTTDTTVLRTLVTEAERATSKISIVNSTCKELVIRIDKAMASAKTNVPPLLPHEVNTIENQINFLPKVAKLFECLHKLETKRCQFQAQVVQVTVVVKEAHELLDFLKATYLSPQQTKDAECELRRLFCLSRICHLKYIAVKEGKVLDGIHEQQLDQLAQYYIKCGVKCPQATAKDQSNTDTILESIRNRYSIGGLSPSELLQVVNAVTGVRKGAWFKCPNGHYYAIGDCGGANEVGTCPECKAKIGGTGHRILDDNVHAGELDNSRYAAWSEQANLVNYDLDHPL